MAIAFNRIRYWDDLKAFLEVADAGAFARVENGTFSHNVMRDRVNRLEHVLGTKLLTRRGWTGVTLTPSGEAVRDRALMMKDLMQ